MVSWITDPFSIPLYFIFMSIFVVVGQFISRASPVFYPRQNSKFNCSLEGLRGFLALSVFFAHSARHYTFRQTAQWLPPPVDFFDLLGSNSVALFFFLSGFLFWKKLIEFHGNLNWKTFFMGRVSRILPAGWFSVAILILVILIQSDFEIRVPLKEFLNSIISWLCFKPAGINTFQNTYVVNAGVFWTLRIEWLFYLILPFLSSFSRKNRSILIVVGVWILHEWLARTDLASSISSGVMRNYAQNLINLMYHIRYGFGWGMIAAWLTAVFPSASFLKSRVASILAIILLGLCQSNYFSLPYQRIFLFCFFIILVYGNNLFGILTSKSALFLGKISYSIYLFHGLILWVTRAYGGKDPAHHWIYTGFVGLLTLVIAALIYRYVEYPFSAGYSINPQSQKDLNLPRSKFSSELLIFSLLIVGIFASLFLVDFKPAHIRPREVVSFNDTRIKYISWGAAEDTHRWSLGKRAIISFKLKDINEPLAGEIVMGCGSLGKQRIIASLNGTKIYEGTLDTTQNILTMKFDPELLVFKGDENKLEFILPDAHLPSNGDIRKLAILLNSFVVK